ncbi:MAG: D-glycero-beta-D-manno-heptose 1,7-bisphosphate 7-phosphatase [Gammaproteobacteria bacterium]|nr:D-glycero-beta-D-manno-heptose 1,7-bisphosphate 7-phosphatase [Gammaproteobacteria bacterium]
MKLIILDRDGVINEDSDHFIKTPDEWIPLPGSLAAIARLNRAGYTVAVATNQSGIARGLFTVETLQAMHAKFRALLAAEGGKVDAIYYCDHGPAEDCNCRKPLPGMYLQAAADFDADLRDVPVIGDSFRDLEAALAVNARPIAVKTGKGERTLESHAAVLKEKNIPVYDNLASAVDALLAGEV